MEEEKEDCPLCSVSEETIKNLEKAGPSKKEKYLLKKEKKEQEHLVKTRKKKNKKIIKFSLIFLIIILITGGAVFGIIKYIGNKNFGTPKVETFNLEYDAGTISMADGLVKNTYEIKNIGQGDLKINKMWTSCMCTTARLKVGDSWSREFSMHDSSFLWSETIKPGKTAYLEVVFDPNFHGPEGTGPITRAVYVSTNDPENKELEFVLLVNVIE
jgi:hypothetical protein